MTNNVLLSIAGYQSGPEIDNQEGNEPVEVITPAKYYFKNGKHYLLYDEVDPEDRTFTHTTLKIRDDHLSVSRRGDSQSLLQIESGRRNVTYYASPLGSLHILLDGKSVMVDESESQIDVKACYGLEINYEHIADCELRIRITPRETV